MTMREEKSMSPRSKKIDFKKLPQIVEPQNDLVLKQLLSAEESNGALSVTWVELDGKHRPLISHSRLRVYVVISGSFTFTVNESVVYHLEKNDALTLNPGSRYSLSGNGEYVVLNVPAFTQDDDEYLSGH